MERRSELPIPYGWFGVAFSKDIQPGEVRVVRYFDRDIVLFRTESGVAAAVDAHCPHLGAHLGHGGRVVGERIACPFHAWEFDCEGACKHIPYAKRVPPAVRKPGTLQSYRTVEVNQVIWVWYHPHAIEPTFEVAVLQEVGDPSWAELRIHDWTVDSAVQEAAENAADVAHFAVVHRSQNPPTGDVVHAGVTRSALFHSKVPGMNPDGTLDDSGTRWRENTLETCNNGPGQTWQRFTGLFDTLLMGMITPIDAGRFHLRFAFTQQVGMNDMQKRMAKGLVDEVCRQVEQDIPIWNHKVYRPEPVLCDGDGPIGEFRRWFAQFYVE